MKATNFKRLKKGLSPLFLGLLIVGLASSCNENDDINPADKGATIKFTSTTNATKSAALKSDTVGDVFVESLIINIGEIELEFDDDDPMFENDSVASDYELEGPFAIDLMKDGNALETTLANNVDLPEAAYDEIEFELEEGEDSGSPMYGKAIYVEGTINNTPFVFWSDEELELELEFDNDVMLEKVRETLITVSVNVSSLFDPVAGGVDMTSAVDGNEDGTIEIHPDDPDGNSDLAEHVMETLEDALEAYEDSFDDDDDDEGDDDEGDDDDD
ncbi:MAG: hypothetical protein ACQEQ0_07175 [Bacteroidota bacterium]